MVPVSTGNYNNVLGLPADVARMAGVSEEVVVRAEGVSDEFFQAFKGKLQTKRQSAYPLEAQADFVFLVNTALQSIARKNGSVADGRDDGDGDVEMGSAARVNVKGKAWKMASLRDQLEVIKRSIGCYEA